MAKRKKRQPKNLYQLDIVIPVYGRPDLLQKCLDSIEATRGEIKTHVIIVDDRGPNQDELGKIYHSLNGHSRVVRHKENQGFPRTVNDGIAAGNAPLVLILNSDIELKPGCLQAMMAEFDNPGVGIVGPKLLFPEGSNDPRRPGGKVQHAGLCVNFTGHIQHANISWPSDHPRVNERREMQAVTGACLMVRRDILKKIHQAYNDNGDPTQGPINEVYGKGTYEDIELCFASRAANYQVVYTPLAEAYHEVGASVLQDGGAYPLDRNEMIFRARCGQLLMWDEWRYL